MFDHLRKLRTSPQLLELFSRYAKPGESNRETWVARLMQIEGVQAAELTKLHGDLIAFDWLEQNSGQMPCCYRLTLAGLRAFRRLQRQDVEDDDVTSADIDSQAA